MQKSHNAKFTVRFRSDTSINPKNITVNGDSLLRSSSSYMSGITKTRGPKGHILCTWVQCATFLTHRPSAQVSPFWLLIGLKNTNYVEDFQILLYAKFRWILFSGFIGEVENVSANQRPGWASCFSDRPKKHKLGRGRWDLASCQVSLNSYQQFQRRTRKCLNQSEATAAILFFRSARKTQTW